MKNKLQDVFKLSGVPEHNFVEPEEYDRIKVSIGTAGRSLIIEGPSGIGKTTSIKKALNDLNLSDSVRILSARKRFDLQEIKETLNKEVFGIIVIDDFHRLDEKTKEEYADLIKVLADEEDEENKVIIIGINKTSQPLLKIASDLAGRIDIVKLRRNKDEKVSELIGLGEKSLNIKIPFKEAIVQSSEGSFQIAQILAHRSCLSAKILETQDELTTIEIDFNRVKSEIFQDFSLSFFDLAKSFAIGQRVKKGSRAPYLHVLHWLSKAGEWSINIRDELVKHPKHKASVGQIIDRGHLHDHLESKNQLKSIIYYDDVSSILSIEDPKFFFFIKNLNWNDFAVRIGFSGLDFGYKYDFALSFAGAKRELAKEIFDILSESEIAVFYDFNEQHSILAEKVEDYLSEIYSNESEFILPILSAEYSSRVWCKFEAANFQGRLSKNAVIPILFKDNYPGFFDSTSGIGSITVNEDLPVREQAAEICSVLIEKIHQSRRNKK